MATPAELALELLAAFDADYDTRRQALVDALVDAGLIEVEEPASEEPTSYTPWGVEKITYPVPNLGQDVVKVAAAMPISQEFVEQIAPAAPKPSQVERINDIATQRAQRQPMIASKDEQIAACLTAIEEGRQPVAALVDLGYTYGSATVLLKNLRRDGHVPPSTRGKRTADLPRPGFDLEAAHAAIEGAA
jgi:hypothetical protein